jgi:hypothetical protein
MHTTVLKTETFDIEGRTVRAHLCPDHDPPNPREHATFGILCLPHMDCTEDESAPDVSSPDEFWRALANMAAGRKFHAHKRDIEEEIRQRTADALSGEDGPSWDETRDLQQEKEERLRDVARDIAQAEYVASAVHKHEHGRVQLNLDAGESKWDSGQVGWMYARRSVAADRLFAEDRDPTEKEVEEKAHRTFENELDVLSTWLNGEVVGYRLFGPGGEEIDACWCFYDWTYALDEARRSAKAHLEKQTA